MSQSPTTVAAGSIVVGLLGPTLVSDGADDIPINGPRQRSLLAILALHPGRLVSADSLVHQVWHGDPPPTAASAMRVHLARLRKVLAGLSDGSALLIFQPPGYRLHESVTTDAVEYEQLVNSARTHVRNRDFHEALVVLDDAEKMWRGPAMSGTDTIDTLRAEAERLDGLRLDAQEEQVEVRLILGHHEALCSPLQAAVRRAPLRERRTAQLMLAMHRSGRQADALKACRSLRRMLVDELGVEPGTAVQQLEGSILRNDPALVWTPQDGSVESEPVQPEVSVLSSAPAVGGGSTVPQLVRALVSEWLGRLSPSARRLVCSLAVLDGESTTAVLARAMDRPLADIEQLVAEVFTVGGLLNRVVAPGAVALQSGQFARAIRDDHLSGPALAELHLTVGRALQHVAPSAHPQRVARHLLAAGAVAPCGDMTRAVVLGADQALRLGDADEAADLACGALCRLADETGFMVERIDLLLRLIRAEAMRGRVEVAEVEWNRALGLARETHDAERFALVVLARDWTRQMVGEDGGDIELLSEALDLLPPTASAVRIRLGSALLTEAALPGRHLDISALMAEVDTSSRAVGDDAALLAALSARHVLLRRLPVGAEIRDVTVEFQSIARRHGEPFWRATADLAALYLALRVGTCAEIDQTLDAYRKQVVPAASGRLTWALALSECTVAGMRGDFERANQFADEAAAKGAAAGISDALPASLIHRFLTDFHTSSVARHGPTLQAMMQIYPGFSLIQAGAVLSAVHAGADEDAAALLGQLVDRLESGPRDEAFVMSAAIAAEAAARSGVIDGAQELAGIRGRLRSLLAPYRDEFVVFGQIAGVFGPVGRHLTVLDIADSPRKTHLEDLRAARRQSMAANSPIWAVRCEADSVRLLRVLGRPQAAEDLAARVRPKVRALGLTADLLEADSASR